MLKQLNFLAIFPTLKNKSFNHPNAHMTLSSYRKYFPISSTDIYLNHAAVSPLSTRVMEDIQAILVRRSRGPVELFPQLMEEIVRLKENLATLIGAEKENIAIISNTSEGFNWLVNGL